MFVSKEPTITRVRSCIASVLGYTAESMFAAETNWQSTVVWSWVCAIATQGTLRNKLADQLNRKWFRTADIAVRFAAVAAQDSQCMGCSFSFGFGCFSRGEPVCELVWARCLGSAHAHTQELREAIRRKIERYAQDQKEEQQKAQQDQKAQSQQQDEQEAIAEQQQQEVEVDVELGQQPELQQHEVELQQRKQPLTQSQLMEVVDDSGGGLEDAEQELAKQQQHANRAPRMAPPGEPSIY